MMDDGWMDGWMDRWTDGRDQLQYIRLKNADIIPLHGFSFKVGMPWKLTVSE